MSILFRCDQGSAEWRRLRLGLPTASRFDMLITASGKRSEQATRLRNELIAEHLLGETVSEDISGFVDRGVDLEESALRYYEMQREVDVERVGFVMRDDRRSGCSPDGLIGDTGGLELKVPSASTHIGYLLDGAGDKYRAQVQGCLWICEREYWDFLSFNPILPPVLVRVQRDESYIKQLGMIVDMFCDQLAATKEELRARGYEPAAPEPPSFYAGVG